MSSYYGMFKENKLKETEHDYFRDIAKNQFLIKNLNGFFEYENKVSFINKNVSDYYFKNQKNLKEIRKDTQNKNNKLKQLLSKRKFSKKEENLFTELTIKQRKDEITYEEDIKLEYLFSIKFNSSTEERWKSIFNNIDKIYYYKDAYKTLNNNKKTEWNGDITYSKEIFVNNDNQKRVKITIVKGDVIDYIEKNKKTQNSVLINTASHLNPGGSWERGDYGTEESLFYRSSYELSLSREEINDGFYPLLEEATIISPKVIVFKHGKNNSYKMKNETLNPLIVSIISCCRLYTITYKTESIKKTIQDDDFKLNTKEQIEKKNNLNSSDLRFSDKTENIYRNKLKNIFKTALYWGFKSIVFDSFGCNNYSTYKIPIRHCTNIIKSVIFDKKDNFFKKFENITFCIDIRDIDNSLKPNNINDPNMYIYDNEQKERNQELNVYKIFHQVLNEIDEYY